MKNKPHPISRGTKRGLIVAAIVAGALLLAVVAYWKLVWEPQKELIAAVSRSSELIQAQSKLYVNFLQALSSIAAFFAGAVAWLSLLWGQQNISESQRIAAEGQITDRFRNAVDQLGATGNDRQKAFEIRLGGIYSLERIARDSENDRKSVVEILAAYIRHNAPLGATSPTCLPTDVQTALTVLGRMYSLEECADPESARIWDGPDLSGTDLTGARLRNAVLPWVNLSDAKLTGAQMENIVLHNSRLESTNLEGAKMDHAYLQRAVLNDANLTTAFLHAATLRSAKLLRTNFTEARIAGADFTSTQHLTQEQVNSAYGDANTKLPPGLVPSPYWPTAPASNKSSATPPKLTDTTV